MSEHPKYLIVQPLDPWMPSAVAPVIEVSIEELREMYPRSTQFPQSLLEKPANTEKVEDRIAGNAADSLKSKRSEP